MILNDPLELLSKIRTPKLREWGTNCLGQIPSFGRHPPRCQGHHDHRLILCLAGQTGCRSFFTFIVFDMVARAFLIGRKRQVSMMLNPALIYAAVLYLASIIIVHNKLLTLLAIVLEFGALICLSYIPFARSMVSKVMLACFDTEF
ncbi:hypothetical protein UlMin_023436 [Ulmus minor]